jgi:hypothetical protein
MSMYAHFLRPMSTHLQHLNEGDAQIEIGLVSTDQAQTEEEADREDGAEVDLAGHLDSFASIEKSRGFRQELGHERRKNHVPCRQGDGKFEAECVQQPLVE